MEKSTEICRRVSQRKREGGRGGYDDIGFLNPVAQLSIMFSQLLEFQLRPPEVHVSMKRQRLIEAVWGSEAY